MVIRMGHDDKRYQNAGKRLNSFFDYLLKFHFQVPLKMVALSHRRTTADPKLHFAFEAPANDFRRVLEVEIDNGIATKGALTAAI